MAHKKGRGIESNKIYEFDCRLQLRPQKPDMLLFNEMSLRSISFAIFEFVKSIVFILVRDVGQSILIKCKT